ncbi:MAG: hypothetical protein F4089_05760 [Gammaproteobacteria bacterium]|nr:hypothetical protein [Gammaproteobacteria bacterium]
MKIQYHLEHHMYPAVPFYNLPKLRKAIEHDLPPATHGLVATWRELLALRKKCINDPTYRFVPECPAPTHRESSRSNRVPPAA